MFLTNLFYSLKKIYDYLTFPSKRYAEKYSKFWSKKYVDEYLTEKNLKVSPSPSVSSSQYATRSLVREETSLGETPPSPRYNYNNY